MKMKTQKFTKLILKLLRNVADNFCVSLLMRFSSITSCLRDQPTFISCYITVIYLEGVCSKY